MLPLHLATWSPGARVLRALGQLASEGGHFAFQPLSLSTWGAARLARASAGNHRICIYICMYIYYVYTTCCFVGELNK